MRKKHEELTKEKEDKERRAKDRADAAEKKAADMRREAQPLIESIESGQVTLETLTKTQMYSVLTFHDRVPTGMKTLKKADLLHRVKALPHLSIPTIAPPPSPPPPPRVM